MPVDAGKLPDDKYGYSQYGVMLHATPEQVEKVREFHEAIGMGDLATRAHTSVCAGLYDLPDMGELEAAIRRVASQHRPFRLVFESNPFKAFDFEGNRFAVWEVVPTPELLAFREAMVEGLQGVIKSSAPSDRPYWPHLTVYLFATAEEAARSDELGPQLDLGDGYDVASVELIGRSGHPRGGTFEIIDSFPLG